MTQEIRTRLLLMADAQYGSFSKSLIPECKPLLGVRLPALRKMAQEFVKNKEWKELVQTDGADDVYFEEAMLRGMLINFRDQIQSRWPPPIAHFATEKCETSVCGIKQSLFGSLGIRVIKCTAMGT